MALGKGVLSRLLGNHLGSNVFNEGFSFLLKERKVLDQTPGSQASFPIEQCFTVLSVSASL